MHSERYARATRVASASYRAGSTVERLVFSAVRATAFEQRVVGSRVQPQLIGCRRMRWGARSASVAAHTCWRVGAAPGVADWQEEGPEERVD